MANKVREFKLVNEKGQTYSLMDIKNYALLTEPDGLGYSYSTSYTKVGEVFINNIKEQEAITSVLSVADREIDLLQQDIQQETQRCENADEKI